MLGLDLGSKNIKAISLAKSGDEFLLKSSGAVGFSGVTPDKMNEEKEFSSLAEIVKKLLKQTGILEKEAVISIPESLTFSKVIEFPMLSEEEIASAVKWEAEQYIPIPANEAVIQHTILDSGEKTSKALVYLVAVPKVIIEKYIKLYRLSGIIPVIAEPESLALARCFTSSPQPFVILHIGASFALIVIVDNGKVFLTRSIPTGGYAFTRAVAQGLGINIQQAEEYKKTYGLADNKLEGKVSQSVSPVLRIIVDEIKKSIYFYQGESKKEPPSFLTLSGGTSFMPGIAKYLSESLGIETMVGNPFSKIKVDPEAQKLLSPYSSLYSISVGLAMREI